MKTSIKNFGSALLVCASLTVAQFAGAQAVSESTTTTSTTTSMGTVSQLSQDALVIKDDTGMVRYSYPKTVTIVDEQGAVLTHDALRSGLPVTVYYTGSGENRVVSRVVVRRAAPAGVIEKREESTTTTTVP